MSAIDTEKSLSYDSIVNMDHLTEYYTINFSDAKISIDKDNIIKIPYFKNIIDSGLQESITKEFNLLDYKYENFMNIHNYIITNNITKNSLSKEEIVLCDYLNFDSYIEQSIMMCSKKYLIDNNIYTHDEIVLNDFINYENKLIFNDVYEFDTYLSNMDTFDLTKDGKYGFIHILAAYSDIYSIDITPILHKININAIDKENNRSPLMLACRYSNTTSSLYMVEFLLACQNIDVNIHDNKGYSALMIASYYSNSDSNIETVKALLYHKDINVNDKNSYNGLTALMLAPNMINESYTIKAFTEILAHEDIDVNVYDSNGNTILMSLCVRNKDKLPDIQTIHMLLANPKLDINRRNKYGSTALHIACTRHKQYSCDNVVMALLSHEDINVNIQDNNGLTALMRICWNTVQYSSPEIMKMLLSHKNIDVYIRDNNDNNALMIAYETQHEYGMTTNITKVLLRRAMGITDYCCCIMVRGSFYC